MTERVPLFNFRINSKLKKEFSDLCKLNYSNTSAELRAFILRSIESGKLNYDSPSLLSYGSSSSHSVHSRVQTILDKARASAKGGEIDESLAISEYFELNSTCNIKLDTDLKERFLKAFPNTKLSAELKRFMSHIVRSSN